MRVAFLDDTYVVSAASDGKVRVFQIAGKEPVAVLDGKDELLALTVSADGKFFAAGDNQGQSRVWSWPGGTLVSAFRANNEVSALAFGSGARASQLAVASGKEPFDVSLWDVTSGTRLATYAGHDNRVMAVAMSPDGNTIASAGGNRNQIDLWSPDAPAQAKATLSGFGRSVWGVGFLRAPDDTDSAGTYMAWGFTDPCPGSRAARRKTASSNLPCGFPISAARGWASQSRYWPAIASKAGTKQCRSPNSGPFSKAAVPKSSGCKTRNRKTDIRP